MVAAAEKHHVKVAVAHQTRSAPRTKQVKDLIAAGTLGDIIEIRAHGKTDKRGGGEDLIVLGTHTFDLMRLLVGDPKWCFARVSVKGRRPVAADVTQAGEQIGPVIGDHIFATYGFDGKAVGTFVTYPTADKTGPRYWTEIRGTKGIVQIGFGAIPPAYFCPDPTWMTGSGKAKWEPVTSAGLGKPEPLTPKDIVNWNRWIVDDLIEAIEKDRPPMSSLADGRAALEMIMAVYESYRLDRPVDFPLKTRKHPLSLL
jgi:predicted dehydrogenase